VCGTQIITQACRSRSADPTLQSWHTATQAHNYPKQVARCSPAHCYLRKPSQARAQSYPDRCTHKHNEHRTAAAGLATVPGEKQTIPVPHDSRQLPCSATAGTSGHRCNCKQRRRTMPHPSMEARRRRSGVCAGNPCVACTAPHVHPCTADNTATRCGLRAGHDTVRALSRPQPRRGWCQAAACHKNTPYPRAACTPLCTRPAGPSRYPVAVENRADGRALQYIRAPLRAPCAGNSLSSRASSPARSVADTDAGAARKTPTRPKDTKGRGPKTAHSICWYSHAAQSLQQPLQPLECLVLPLSATAPTAQRSTSGESLGAQSALLGQRRKCRVLKVQLLRRHAGCVQAESYSARGTQHAHTHTQTHHITKNAWQVAQQRNLLSKG
jgi:hypothetical protein